ncbi:MAG: hypothetical protein ABR907_15690 [Terracidiphilus sp.]|jgi:hypothetical protein
MTTVVIQFRYATPPSDAVTQALADTREVYGIRQLNFDRAARTLCVEYDATRLNAAAVAKLIRQAGLEIETIPAERVPEEAPAA